MFPRTCKLSSSFHGYAFYDGMDGQINLTKVMQVYDDNRVLLLHDEPLQTVTLPWKLVTYNWSIQENMSNYAFYLDYTQ